MKRKTFLQRSALGGLAIAVLLPKVPTIDQWVKFGSGHILVQVQWFFSIDHAIVASVILLHKPGNPLVQFTQPILEINFP